MKLKSILSCVTIISFALSLLIANAVAQDSSYNQQYEDLIKQTEGSLEDVERTLSISDKDDAALIRSRGSLEKLQIETNDARNQIAQRLITIETELTELGAAPAENTLAESSLVTERRLALTTERSVLSVLSSRVSNLNTKIQAEIGNVAKIRRDIFTNAIVMQTDLNSTLFNNAIAAAQSEVSALRQLIAGWWRFSVAPKMTEALLSTFLALFVAFGLVRFAKISTNSVFKDDEFEPTYFTKLAWAFWRAVLPSLALIAFLSASYALYSYFNLFTVKIDLIVTSLFPVLTGVFLVRNLAMAVFAPQNSDYRLVPMPTSSAKKMVYLTIGLAVVNGLDIFISRLNEVVSAPLALTVIKSLIAALLIGIILLAISRVIGQRIKTDDTTEQMGWSRWISTPITLVAMVIIVTAFTGYIGLARFISQQVVITGAILVIMYIGFLIGREIGSEGVFAETRLGKWLAARFNLQSVAIEQLSVVFSLLTTAIVFLLGLPLLLLQWGSQLEDVTFLASKLFFGFEVGSVNLSLATALIAVVAFIIVYLITRVFRRWLDKNVLVRSRMDTGVQDSIKTGVSYIGLGLALLFAVTAAGIDLSSLAIVAGALSLGIGFGLQNIVSNFVSGLILLIERPIKVGDWIEVGGISGHVKKISVRATEIMTFQKQSVIVPNSELINSQVGNWTHKDKGGRVDVPVGVAYGTDTRRVEKLLLAIAEDRSDVMKTPAPFVVFLGLGDSSLDFQLRFFVRDIGSGVGITSEILHTIVETFTAENIEIPFPQRDLNVRSIPDSMIDKPQLKTSGKKQKVE